MNWQHFQAFIWLRWRLMINQLRRGGAVNALVAVIVAVAGVLLAIGGFVTAFLVGLLALPLVPADYYPLVLLYVWDGLVVTFLFTWMIGLLIELQRSEVLSLDKFLHLPVSLKGAFLINYCSSLLSPSLIILLPAMVALSLALVITRGPVMLLILPLLAAFFLMVTAVTYQFQGWLASLMVNKRRRRTIIAFVIMGFVLLCQTPQLIHFIRPWEAAQQESADTNTARTELNRKLNFGEITMEKYSEQNNEMNRAAQAQREASDSQFLRTLEDTTRIVNVVLPPGWLPLGAAGAAAGNVVPALLGTLGLTLIGSASLYRAFRTTLRLYTGQFSAGKRATAPVVAVAGVTAKPAKLAGNLLERHVPYVSEQTAAVALGGFRSLTRAPEAKFLLLTPVFMVVAFGSMFLTRTVELPEIARPLAALGAMGMILLSLGQLMGNQFGFDRSGFRAFVLCSASRGDILLGKNLAAAPLALGLAGLVVVAMQVLHPMRVEHFLAVPLQMLSMYLLYCPVANWLSIYAPMPIRSGTMKPANPKLVPVLLHMLTVFLVPLTMAPALLALGIEFAVEELAGVRGVPIYLILSLLECPAIVFAYLRVVRWEGGLLQRREQKILETVTTRAE